MISTIFFLNEQGKRKNVEDTIFPAPATASFSDKLFIVCDGVGGSSKGEEASRIACEAISEFLLAKEPSIINPSVIASAVHHATEEMKSYVVRHPEAENMSTTLTLAYLSPQGIHVAWCGDSRVYHIRDGKVLWQSTDHSLVQQLVEAGEITQEEASVHPKRNIILRSLNANNNSKIDHHVIENFQSKDYILLCTDGILENINATALFDICGPQQKRTDKKQLFLDYCEGKTSDNYSMYLLQLSHQAKTKGNVMKLTSVLLALIVLIFAGYRIWFSKSKTVEGTKEIKTIDNAIPVTTKNNNSGTTIVLLQQLDEHSKAEHVPSAKNITDKTKANSAIPDKEVQEEVLKNEEKKDTSKILKSMPIQQIKKDTLSKKL